MSTPNPANHALVAPTSCRPADGSPHPSSVHSSRVYPSRVYPSRVYPAVPAETASDRRLSVVVFRQIAVVGGAHQADVAGAVVSSHAEGMAVVELQPVPLAAAPPLLVDEAAAVLVALADRPAHGGRDVARRGCCVGLRERLSGSGGLGEAPGFEPLERLGDREFDDRAEVAVSDLRAHESLEPLELVVKLGAGGELHLVACGRQRLEDGGPQSRQR